MFPAARYHGLCTSLVRSNSTENDPSYLVRSSPAHTLHDRDCAGSRELRQPVCDATPVSVGDRLKHARQLRGFHHGIFTPSWDAQQLFNLVGAFLGASGGRDAKRRACHRTGCRRRACHGSGSMQRGGAAARAAALRSGICFLLPNNVSMSRSCAPAVMQAIRPWVVDSACEASFI